RLRLRDDGLDPLAADRPPDAEREAGPARRGDEGVRVLDLLAADLDLGEAGAAVAVVTESAVGLLALLEELDRGAERGGRGRLLRPARDQLGAEDRGGGERPGGLTPLHRGHLVLGF